MESLDALVFFMQIVSLLIVVAGAFLCLVHADVLPAIRPMRGFAIAASCVLFGAALGAVAVSLSMRSAPVEAAVMSVDAVVPLAPPGFIAYPPPTASIGGDADFKVYEYH
jgi:hypothetical protein